MAEMHRQRPPFIRLLRNTDGHAIAIADLGERILQPSGGASVGDQPSDNGRPSSAIRL
jgi:hypothetical protein